MDPLAAWESFKSETDPDQKKEFALALKNWSGMGGFMPIEINMNEVKRFLNPPKKRKKQPNYKQIAKELGLTAVRGAVSGRIYYE